MRKLDSKQKRLIRAWFAKGDSDDEPYFAFMATWIAFNAWCYGQYADKANRQRADLKKGLDAGSLQICDRDVQGRLAWRPNRRLRLDIVDPKLRFDIVERYTEDIIFGSFAADRENETAFMELLKQREFRNELQALHTALEKPNIGHFVINMLRISDYRPEQQAIDDMALCHRGMRISESDWSVFLGHAAATSAKFEVPEAEQRDVVTFVQSLKKEIVEYDRV